MIVWAVTLICIVFGVFVLQQRRKRRAAYPESRQNVSAAPDVFSEETEVLVVGAGILGSAAAATLARDGRQVTVIERDLSEPNRIVGELLQPGGFGALRKLGLEDAVIGIDAHTVRGYAVHDNDTRESVILSYPTDEASQKLQTGRSFHHGRFVMGLREEARKSKVSLVEGTAMSLLENKQGHIVGVLYKEKETGHVKAIKADLTIVADGCFSKFRKGLVNASVEVPSHFAGLILTGCPQFKTGFAEIALPMGGSGPILVYQISSTCTRVLVDIRGKMPSDVKQYMVDTVAPELPEHIRGPFLKALVTQQIRSMPNSFLPPDPVHLAGMILLGDAMNMRHPLTGAGMSVALHDTLIWRDLLRGVPDLRDHSAILSCSRKFQRQRKMSHSFVVNVLAQALYALFSASDGHLHQLRRACFGYFQLGGMAVSGPVGLLSV
jgi:squalene monooxygenase